MDDGDFVRVTDAPLSDTTFEYTYDMKGTLMAKKKQLPEEVAHSEA